MTATGRDVDVVDRAINGQFENQTNLALKATGNGIGWIEQVFGQFPLRDLNLAFRRGLGCGFRLGGRRFLNRRRILLIEGVF